MAGGWPIGGEVCNGTDLGTSLSSGYGTVVSASASANTKGAWVEISASTPHDCTFCVIGFGFSSGGIYAFATDIGIGPSGSEVPIMQNLISLIPGTSTGAQGTAYAFPVEIPTGTRIAARTQCGTGGVAITTQATIFDGGFVGSEGFSQVDTYGFNSAATNGTQVDPGSTANTKGSYSQITAATTYDLAGFMVAFDTLNQSANYTNGIYNLVDIAIGPAGSEVVIYPNIQMVMTKVTASYDTAPRVTCYIPVAIPGGTRIAVRAQSENNTATERLFGITLYGVRA